MIGIEGLSETEIETLRRAARRARMALPAWIKATLLQAAVIGDAAAQSGLTPDQYVRRSAKAAAEEALARRRPSGVRALRLTKP
jgi:hypothetical protein